MKQIANKISSSSNNGKLISVENIIRILKQACDEKNYESQLQAYQALGDYYLHTQSDPINAIALYNFALAICQDNNKNASFILFADVYKNQLVQKIKHAEKQFLYFVTGKPVSASDYQLDQAHREYLKAIRDEARAKLLQHDSLVKKIGENLPANLDRLERIKQVDKVLESNQVSVQQIYQPISEQLRGFVCLLIDECKEVLGQPPCDYAIICFGSLARDEATPYSDLEFGVLIEDSAEKYSQLGMLYYKDKENNYPFIEQSEVLNEKHKQYFRHLTQLLNIKIINLCETTPRMQDIKELREAGLAGRYSENPNKPGFSFDGNNEEGRKTPLGNKNYLDVITREKEHEEKTGCRTNLQYELIDTPRGLAQLHNEEWYLKDKHLSTVLMTAKVIEGNEGLCVEYEQEVEAILSKEISEYHSDELVQSESRYEAAIVLKTVVQRRSLTLLQESIESYKFRGGRFEKEEHFFDVKYNMYRQPNIFIDHLATYFGLKEKNLWDRIESLFNQTGEIPNAAGKLELKEVVSKILRLRLRVYLRCNCRDNHIRLDLIHPERNQAELAKHLIIDQEELFQIYATLIPLELAMEFFVAKNGHKQILLESNYYDDGFSVRGLFYYRLLDGKQAAEAYEQEKQIIKKIHDENHISLIDVWNSLGIIYSNQRRYEEALTAYKEAKRIQKAEYPEDHISLAATRNNLGVLYRSQGHCMKALAAYKKAKRIIKVKCGKNHIFLADYWNNLGAVYGDQARYQEAVHAYEKAYRISMITLNESHTWFAEYLNNLGHIYIKLFRYDEALILLEKAKQIYIEIYGIHHPSIARILYNLGMSYVEKKQFEKAYSLYNQAIQIYEDYKYPGQREIKLRLSHAYIRQANYYMLQSPINIDSAREYYYKGGVSSNDPMDPSPHESLASQFCASNLLSAAREQYEILILLNEQNASYHHKLAYLIHAYAHIEQDKMDSAYHTYLPKAESHFQKAIQLTAHATFFIDYAQFMLHHLNFGDFDLPKIISMLNKAIKLNQLNVGINYGPIVRSIVDSYFQSLIDEFGSILIRKNLLAYYLLVQAYLLANQPMEARRILNLFDRKVSQFNKNFEQNKSKRWLEAAESAQKYIEQVHEIIQAVKNAQEPLQKEQLIVEKLLLQAKKAVISALPYGHKREWSCASVYFKDSPIARMGNAHAELVKRLIAAMGDNQKDFQGFLTAIHQRAYVKALHELCSYEMISPLNLITILLEYHDILFTDINEKMGNKNLAVIHYAAIKDDQLLYNLLVKHGADESLIYEGNMMGGEFMSQQHAFSNSNL